jgi:hypothetical protein
MDIIEALKLEAGDRIDHLIGHARTKHGTVTMAGITKFRVRWDRTGEIKEYPFIGVAIKPLHKSDGLAPAES